MSASLVGSEMCIRDRFKTSQKMAVLVASSAYLPRGLTFGPTNGPEGFQAVSYTHLTLPTICSV
eukprot:3771596-Alexandrium_andersonii.AAC.1